MDPRILVDIDNTLWDFAPALYDVLKRMIPSAPFPSTWRGPFWREYITDAEFRQAMTDVHLAQDSHVPFPEAKAFLSSLRGLGFTIVIASHRAEETRDATEKWLRMYDLVFDELHLSFDKTVLFPSAWGLVDDAPNLLDKAARAGLVRTGLLAPWNAESGHPLFGNLMEVLRYVKGQLMAVS